METGEVVGEMVGVVVTDWLAGEKSKARIILTLWAWTILIFGSGFVLAMLSAYICFLLQTGLYISQVIGFVISWLCILLSFRVWCRILK